MDVLPKKAFQPARSAFRLALIFWRRSLTSTRQSLRRASSSDFAPREVLCENDGAFMGETNDCWKGEFLLVFRKVENSQALPWAWEIGVRKERTGKRNFLFYL